MASVVLLILFALLVLIVLPIWVLVKINAFSADNEVLHARIQALESELRNVRSRLQVLSPGPAPGSPASNVSTANKNEPSPAVAAVVSTTGTASNVSGAPPAESGTAIRPLPPPLLTPPPPLISTAPAPSIRSPEPSPRIQISWEQFMGAKLFAWLGGLAAFLAVAFFVKYSFEHDIIPIQVRAAIGFVLSVGLIIGGVLIKPARFRVTATVLCATGIVSLYAVTYACHAVYEFAAFGPISTFLLMSLITATAFGLAVRTNAQVIAILGLLGGFLTPVLLSTGHDNPPALFGFIALLDLGLMAVAINRFWFHLVPFAAFGTVLMQIGWASKFFNSSKAPVAVVVCLSFCGLFFSAIEIARRLQRSSGYLVASAAAIALASFGFAFYFETFPTIGAHPRLLFVFILAIDLCLLALSWRNEAAARLQDIAGALTLALLAVWTVRSLNDDLLVWGLAAYLGFAILHTTFPVVKERVRPAAPVNLVSQLYPPLALVLMLGPLLKFDVASAFFWPAILLVDVVAVCLALATASIAALGLVLVLTMAAMGVCLFKLSNSELQSGSLLWLIAGFSVFFFVAALFVGRRLSARMFGKDGAGHGLDRGSAQISALSALLPFLLMIMMSQRLHVPTPTPLFGVALLCCLLVLGLTRALTLSWLPLCALIGTAALECAWYAKQFEPTLAIVPLLWFTGFYGLFSVYPFLFRRHFSNLTGPWAVAAISGAVQFPLVYSLVRRTWPALDGYIGALPALFAIAPSLSLIASARNSVASPKRLNQLAWFGGTTLLFLTLVLPIQFEQQWITIGWALEGAALLWLFHRVPHPGLRATGVVLLIVAFCRLAVNPAVLSYHVRSDTPILNWYLYAYGVTIAALFVGARLVAPPRERVLGLNAPPLLNALGVILSFLLLNIEIADYFSTVGVALTFEFGGNFARDLAYTIGWALFALALLGLGIWRSARIGRYAALTLLGITMLKLFLHDLARLGALYRVGALLVVAVVAILASFLYQRFVPSDERSQPPLT